MWHHLASVYGYFTVEVSLPLSHDWDWVIEILFIPTALTEVLALKHESRTIGQWSNRVTGSRKSQAMGQTAQSLNCSIMEKPHTGLDEWPRILLSCFRARNSVTEQQQTASRKDKSLEFRPTGWLWWSGTLVGLTLIWDVPPSNPTIMPDQPNFHLPKQNSADSGMKKISQPNSGAGPPESLNC